MKLCHGINICSEEVIDWEGPDVFVSEVLPTHDGDVRYYVLLNEHFRSFIPGLSLPTVLILSASQSDYDLEELESAEVPIRVVILLNEFDICGDKDSINGLHGAGAVVGDFPGDAHVSKVNPGYRRE